MLAVTWAAESPDWQFGYFFNSNPNGGETNNADIGPVQINYYTWHDEPEVRGVGNVFGSTTTGTAMFDGDPYANLRAGARILNRLGGRTNREHAAGAYRAGEAYDHPKNRAWGPAAYADRTAEFRKWAAPTGGNGYDEFFDCLINGPKK